MSTQNNSNLACGSIPPKSNDFQSNMQDLLKEMGSSQQCKTAADTFFDSGSSTSGSNSQSGSSSNKMNSSLDTSVEGNTSNVYVNGPSAFGMSLGDAGAQNVYSASKTKSDLNTSQQTSQLNLTQQQADAFSKGASKMSSEGCGTVVLNATKISNIKQQMSCVVKKNMTESNKSAKAGASIIIRQIPFNLDACLARANENPNYTENERIQARSGCFQIANTQAKSSLNISGAKLTQKVALTFKDSIKLSSDAKTSLSNMQKEIANNVIESKLTNDNKLDALPQSAKDIISRDESVSNSCSSTSIDEKIQSNKVSVDASANILIESVGSLDASNLVIDQDVMATIITDFLVNDAISSGITIADEIESKFERQIGMSLSAAAESEADKIKALAEANKGVITAGQAGVNDSAANQVAVDAEKLAAANADMNKSNSGLIDSKAVADKGLVEATGKNAVDLTKAQGDAVKGIVDANRADDNSFIIYLFTGLGFLALISLAGAYIKYRSAKKSTDTPTTVSSGESSATK